MLIIMIVPVCRMMGEGDKGNIKGVRMWKHAFSGNYRVFKDVEDKR